MNYRMLFDFFKKTDSVKLFNYSILLIAFFPLLGLKVTVIAIGFFALTATIVFFKQRQYKAIQKRELVNIFVLSIYFLVLGSFYFFAEDKHQAGKTLEKTVSFLIFPLLLIVNHNLLNKNLLKQVLNSFVLGCLLLCGFIWILILSKGYSKLLENDNYYNPVLRNIFNDISGIHLPYLGLLFVFASLVLFTQMVNAKRFFSLHSGFRALGMALLIFSVLTFAARLSLAMFLMLSIFIGFRVLKNKLAKWTIAATIVAISFIFMLHPSTKKRFDIFVNSELTLPHKGQASEDVNFRYGVYNCVFKVMKDNWVCGVGPFQVQNSLNLCYADYTYENYDDYTNVQYNTHNQYFDMILKFGVFGLIFFMIFLLWGIRNTALVYQVFILLTMAALLTENIFDRQVGIVFFTYFNTLFFVYGVMKRQRLENKEISL